AFLRELMMSRAFSLLLPAALAVALVYPGRARRAATAAEPAPMPKAAAAAPGKLEYNRDIRPILAENCFACHGPDSAARKANLRIDQSDEALAAKAFVPGKPDESELVARIFADEPGKVMPPPKAHKKLTAAQKETLKRWIAAGA